MTGEERQFIPSLKTQKLVKWNMGIPKNKKPCLSVIIPSYNPGRVMEDCLNSLENQNTDKTFEVIVIDSSTDGTSRLVEEKFPEVNLHTFSERKFPGDAFNFGISVARGEIIAFIGADCKAESNWVEEIVKAHEAPYPAIGGAIGNGNPESYVGWAAYFTELNLWMPGTPEGWQEDIGSAGMSYKRAVFEKYGGFLESVYCSDTDFHWRLVKNDIRLRFIPSIVITHRNIEKFGQFLRHEFFHGRSFARMRVKHKSFSKLKSTIYAVLFPLIPLKLFIRIGAINFKNMIYLTHFLKVLPLLTLGLVSWSMGECVGYTRG